LRHRLEQSGVAAHVHSAGLLEAGNPAHTHGVAVLSERGLDLSAHRSRPLTADLVRSADLLLGMERSHVREAVVTAPEVFSRTFTLKELVRRGRRVGPRRPGEPLDDWLAKAHEGRTPRELLGGSTEDDVDDPIGQPRAAYERMVAELDGLLDELVWLVWGEAGSEETEPTERAS
jgi:protein-tyrosine phosphatase